MFRSSLNRALDWAERVLAWEDEPFGTLDEPFGGANDRFDGEGEARFGGLADDSATAASPPPHPHRRPLRWERERRPGSVPHPPMHCLSPVVRRGVGARTHDG